MLFLYFNIMTETAQPGIELFSVIPFLLELITQPRGINNIFTRNDTVNAKK